jgi:hypothetical protein
MDAGKVKAYASARIPDGEKCWPVPCTWVGCLAAKDSAQKKDEQALGSAAIR